MRRVSCASWCTASSRRSSPEAGCRGRSSRWPSACRSRSSSTCRSAGCLPRIEATVYFVVAEALTNVAKHAHAQHASVTALTEDGSVCVEVRDDGVGGARPDGSGLIGLTDRLAVLHGTLRVDSPAGGGTLVAATIPLPDEGDEGRGADRFTDRTPLRTSDKEDGSSRRHSGMRDAPARAIVELMVTPKRVFETTPLVVAQIEHRQRRCGSASAPRARARRITSRSGTVGRRRRSSGARSPASPPRGDPSATARRRSPACRAGVR